MTGDVSSRQSGKPPSCVGQVLVTPQRRVKSSAESHSAFTAHVCF